MEPAVTPAFLIDLTSRSLALAGLVALVIRLLRPPSPVVRHWLWTAVAAGMLLLPVAAPVLPSLPVHVLPAPAVPEVFTQDPLYSPTAIITSKTVLPSAPRPAPINWLAWICFSGAVVFLTRFAIAARRLSGITYRSRPIQDFRLTRWQWPGVGIHESAEVTVPVSLAWPAATILLPPCWSEWSAWKLEAAIEHELAHARRADWASAMLARLNRCLFWFNPVAWWLEREVAALAERASDDQAATKLGDRTLYARALVEVASLLIRGHRVVPCAVAMARTPHLTHRVDRLLNQSPPAAIGRRIKVALATLLPAAVFLAGAVELRPQADIPEGEVRSGPLYQDEIVAANNLTPSGAAELEQRLANNPEDFKARVTLIHYYGTQREEQQRTAHLHWFILNHPDADVFQNSLINSRDPQVRQLWREQAESHWGNPQVLGNAARSMRHYDLFDSERYYVRAREVDPPNQEWIVELAKLYASGVRASLSSGRIYSSITTEMWKTFSEHSTRILEGSSDAVLIGTTAEEFYPSLEDLIANPRLARLGTLEQSSPLYDLAAQLLTRAQSIEPSNERWARDLQDLAAFRGGTAVRQSALVIEPSAAGTRRVRVGAEVQRRRLNHYIRPTYPSAALENKIQGTVRFNALITPDGSVAELVLVSGPPALIESATEAVKQWTYRPTTLRGEAVEVQTVIEVPFAIEGRGATTDPKSAGPNSI